MSLFVKLDIQQNKSERQLSLIPYWPCGKSYLFYLKRSLLAVFKRRASLSLKPYRPLIKNDLFNLIR